MGSSASDPLQPPMAPAPPPPGEELPLEPSPDPFHRPAWLGEAPFWATSAVLHLVLFVLFLTVMVRDRPPDTSDKVLRVSPATKVPAYDPTPERDVKKTPRILHQEERELPVVQRKIEEVTPDIPKGTDLSNFADVNLLSAMTNDAIGLAGGAAGAYGERWGKGSLIREGGSAGTESAVRAALEWLRRHQSRNGGWRSREFTSRCKTRCKNKNPRHGDPPGPTDYNVGVTGLAMLAFTGYGHTHRFGSNPEYVDCLRRAAEYMKRIQVQSNDPKVNGRYGGTEGHWPYDHSIATMAMAELLVMSGDVLWLKRSVEDAVELIFEMQNRGAAWRYGVRDGDNDTSVTGWMVLALKTAKASRLSIPEERFRRAFDDALSFIDDVSDGRGRTGYRRSGDFRTSMPCMTAVGVLCRLFGGERRSSSMIRNGIDVCLEHLPDWDESRRQRINIYYWYYASYALFQYGQDPWRRWNVALTPALVKSQRQGGCEDGSWDPIGEWGPRGGRVYSTALGAMTLEVYYRYRRSRDGVGFLNE